MSTVLDPIRVNQEKKQFQDIVEDIAGSVDQVHWQYSANSNERFPLRAYASAVQGTGPDAEELLVIAVTWRVAHDDKGDCLIVGADILDGDGLILVESPKHVIAISPEAEVGSVGHPFLDEITDELHVAMVKIGAWLDSQTPTILGTLAGAA